MKKEKILKKKESKKLQKQEKVDSLKDKKKEMQLYISNSKKQK